MEVYVLIGADYYWHFLTGAIKRGESGPTALQTKVGWVLSGPVQGGSALNLTQVNFTNTHALRVDTHDQFMNESSENRALERKLAEFWDLEDSTKILRLRTADMRSNYRGRSVTQLCPTITHTVKED